MSQNPLVLFCDCACSDIIPLDTKQEVRQGLEHARIPVIHVPDLCGLAARRDPRLQSWSRSSRLAVIACFPRAVHWLFYMGDAPLAADTTSILNMRTQSPQDIVAKVKETSSPQAPGASTTIDKPQDEWIPWFPVIDYGRCQTCKLCYNFCLFGVYELSPDDKVHVSNPTHCKTNCPACARVCPQQAIMFPKHSDPPINGDVPRTDTAKAAGGSTLETLRQGNVHDLLRARSLGHRRFSGDPRERARSSLDVLHKELDIPLDVLQSLSPADLARIHCKALGKDNGGTGHARG